MSARSYEPSVLQRLPTRTANTVLLELIRFCSSAKGKRPAIYTGTAGLALALWRAGTVTKHSDWCDQASQIAQGALQGVLAKPNHFVTESLLDGTAGIILANCLVSAQLHPAAVPTAASYSATVQLLLAEYTSICQAAAGPSPETSDEFLYGRAGTLFGALLLRHQLGIAAVPDAVIGALVDRIIVSGRALADRLPVFRASGCPLAYLWPPGPSAEPYLGAAHGLMGILYVLLHCQQWLQQDPRAMADIIASLQYILEYCEVDLPGYPAGSGGHYPTLMQLKGVSYPADREPLVHWCHGAPGAVFLWCKAYEVFSHQSYLDAALRASEVVWQRGLLKKGPGLCHGVAGNAYALLRLWKTTQDARYLDRAQLFASFIASEAGQTDWSKPDHPASLYEGAAGAICLLAELQAVQAVMSGQASSRGTVAAAEAPAGPVGTPPTGAAAAAGLVAFPLYEMWG